MNKIIDFSINNRIFICLITAVLIYFGQDSFQKLSIDAVPDITNTQVQINTAVNGLVPEEVERMVTFPIEYAMNGMANVETVRSLSRYGISQVTVIFEEGTDIYKARQLTSENLQNIELPEGIQPRLGPLSTGLGEIFHYSLEAKTKAKTDEERLLQLMELRSLQDWYIKPRLLNVKGITEVNTIGGFEKQFFIQPKIKEMARYGIHFDDIESALRQTNHNVGGGSIQQTGEQFLVRGIGLLQKREDIESVVVKRLNTYKIIHIKDIATVKFDRGVRTGAATLDSHESIIGTAFMLLGENSREVSLRVEERIQEIKKSLPKWVDLKILYNRSDMVNATLGTVEHNLLMGAGLVIAFLLILVGNLRAALITALMIPLSLLMTFILMRWQNISGNLMSLGALDFGIIVDGAVIVVENCVHHIQKRANELGRDLTRSEVKEIVKEASCEIRSAAGFGELIVITVFIPLFALGGVEGKMFIPMATTFIMALISALALSFTVVPALASTFLSGKRKESKQLIMVWLESLLERTLLFGLRIKRVILGLGIVSIALGIGLFTQMGSEFIPQLDEGDFALQFIRPANISIDNSIELQKISEQMIKEFPQVEHVFARTGAAEIATDPMGVNISDCYVMLKDIDLWPKGDIKNKEDLIEAIKDKINESVVGQAVMASQPVELRFNELLEGAKSPLTIKVYGDDLDELIEISKKIVGVVSEVDGAQEVESESKGKTSLLEYRPKLKALSELGVTARPVLDTIEIAIGGKKVGDIYEGLKRYPIVTRLGDRERRDIDLVRELPVGISEGFTIPIKEVADIQFSETFASISRENSQRRVAVLITPKGRDMESFVLAAQKRVEQEISLPQGYFLEWGGSFKNLQRAKKRLYLLVPLALLAILAMLYTAFRNFSQVLLIFLCAPMSLVGGVLSLKLMGLPFSISAGVGFMALAGISILNGVVLVTYFNDLKSKKLSPDDVILKGTLGRLRPVMMTALTDIFGFLPMMYSMGLGAGVQRPLATVVVGGIISSTLLTLLVLPVIYRLSWKYHSR